MVRSSKLISLFTFGGGRRKIGVHGTLLLKLIVSAYVFAFCCGELVFNRVHIEPKNEEACQVLARSHISHQTLTSVC